MKRLSTILAVALVLSMSSFGSWVSEAEACDRSRCVIINGCVACESLVLFFVECEVLSCTSCVHFPCTDPLASLDSGIDQAPAKTACENSEEVKPPAVRVVALEWKEDRT